MSDDGRARVAAVAPWLLVLSLPLIVVPGAFHAHVTGRWVALGLVGAVAAALAAAVRPDHLPPAVIWAWIAVVGTALLATVTAPLPLDALLGDSARRMGLITIAVLPAAYVVGASTRHARTEVLRASTVLSLILVLMLSVRLVAGGLLAARSALVGNSGQLGGYLVLLAGLSLVVARTDADPRWRVVGAVASIGALGSVVLTGSYAATLAAVALCAWLFWDARRSSPTTVAVAVTGGLALLGIALVWSEQYRALAPSIRGRVETWLVSIGVIAERPLTGWGLEGFRHGFAASVPTSFVATWGDDRIQDRAHSLPLDHLAATGLLGGVALLVFVVVLVRSIDRGDPVDRSLLAVLGAMGVFLLGWFPEFELAAALLAVAGLATAPSHDRAPPMAARLLGATTALAALLVVVVGGYALIEDRRFQAELTEAASALATDGSALQVDPTAPMRRAMGRTMGYTEQLAAVGLLDRADREQLAHTLAALVDARPWQSPERDAEVAYVRARLLDAQAAQRGEPAETVLAERAYRQVLALAPRHSSALRGLASVQLRQGDPAALDSLRQLTVLRPDDVGPRYDLTVVHLQLGELDAAAHWLTEACRIDADDPQLVPLIDQAEQAGVEVASCR